MDSGSKYVAEAVTTPVSFSIPAYRLNERLNFLFKKKIKNILNFYTNIKIDCNKYFI